MIKPTAWSLCTAVVVMLMFWILHVCICQRVMPTSTPPRPLSVPMSPSSNYAPVPGGQVVYPTPQPPPVFVSVPQSQSSQRVSGSQNKRGVLTLFFHWLVECIHIVVGTLQMHDGDDVAILLLAVVLVLVLKDQNAVLVLVLVLDDAVLVLAAEVLALVLVLEQKSLVMSLCSVLFKSQFTETACAWCKLACYLFMY